MQLIDSVGYLAAVLGTICWLPQSFKAWRSKETADLSLSTNLLIMATMTLWLAYGIMAQAWPLIIANLLSLVLVGSIVLAKLIYK